MRVEIDEHAAAAQRPQSVIIFSQIKTDRFKYLILRRIVSGFYNINTFSNDHVITVL